MKHAEFNIDSYKIEYFNSLFGNKKIYVNGNKVSNKFSVFGAKQRFNLDSDNYTLSSSYELFGKQEINLELKK